MPLSRYIYAVLLESPSKACFDVVYAAPAVPPCEAAIEAMLTMTPLGGGGGGSGSPRMEKEGGAEVAGAGLLARRWGRQARMRKKGPLRLMDRTLVQDEVVVVPVAAKLSIMPAQLIRMSMLGGVR